MIRFYDVNRVWSRLLYELATASLVAPRGKPTREHLGAQLQFASQNSLLTCPERKLNYRFAAAEALWMVLGRDDVASLARVNPRMREFSDDGRRLAGAYGPRFRQQLPYVLETLARDPLSRQAVVEIWRPSPGPSKDVPCTLSWQFLLRDGRLHLVATMRSSDAWLGVPYDAFSFSVVLQYVAGRLGARGGTVTMNLGSSHVYAEHWEEAAKIDEMVRGFGNDELTWPQVLLELEPLADERERSYAEVVCDRALDKGVALNADRIPAGWGRLVRAVAAKTSAEALEVLRGAA